jgi:hypothetical protein
VDGLARERVDGPEAGDEQDDERPDVDDAVGGDRRADETG